MAQSDFPRKQHYLPQFYLKRFSVDGAGIYQIGKARGTAMGVRIKDAAAIRDFHRIEDEPDPYILEKKLAVIEGQLAPQLQKFLSGSFHVRHIWRDVIQLLSLLRLRVPAVRDHIQASGSAARHAQLKQLEERGEIWPPDAKRGGVGIDDFKIEMQNWWVMERMFGMALDHSVLAQLRTLRPTLLHAPMGARFITSDQPVSLFHPEAASVMGIGPETPGVVIALPLSSRSALLLQARPGRHEGRSRFPLAIERLCSSTEVKEINRRTSIMASTWIFTGEAPGAVIDALANTDAASAGFDYRRDRLKAAGGTS